MIPAKLPHRREAGIALLAVILGLIVLSVLAIGLVMITRAGVFEAHSDLESSEARAWSDAIMLQTADALLNTSSPTRPRIDGVPQYIPVMGQNIPVTVMSEFGKIDLNAADLSMLTTLLEAAGQGPALATATAGQIIAWRARGTGMAESHTYRSISELRLIPGVSNALYAAIAPAITVYSGRGSIDESTAPLLALEAGEGMDRLTAESFIQARNRNGNGNAVAEVADGQLQPGIGITGWAFTIDADFTVGTRREHLTAVIRMSGDATRPYLTLWRHQSPE